VVAWCRPRTLDGAYYKIMSTRTQYVAALSAQSLNSGGTAII
jgi:hypothetical protein